MFPDFVNSCLKEVVEKPYPCVVAHHLKQSRNTFQALIEMMTLSERVVNSLAIISFFPGENSEQKEIP